MSERTFFDKRLTVPGFTFLLVVLTVNLNLVKCLFQMENVPDFAVTVIGALLGFILSGPAIGFLVSQFWYLISETILRGRLYLGKRVSKVLTKCKVKADTYIRIAISDHIGHSYKSEAIRKYQERRWDLLNLMGSVCAAIPLGLAYGYLIRLLLRSSFYLEFELFAIVPMLILCAVVGWALHHVLNETQYMLELIIRSEVEKLTKDGKKLSDVYPKEYFES